MKRLLITGTRLGWNQHQLVDWLHWGYNQLTEPPDQEVILVHGDAPGVDSEAATWWRLWEMPTEEHPADWTLGARGGPLRNQEMVDLGADLCLAFPSPDSRGTWDCVKRAEKAGIRVVLCNKEVPHESTDQDHGLQGQDSQA